MFGLVFVLVIGLFMVGVICFWCEILLGVLCLVEIVEVLYNVLMLKYFDGGYGKGCNEVDDVFMLLCCCFYYFIFYGFMFCFVVMVVVMGYYYVVGWEVFYLFFSLLVMFGMLGGIGLFIGLVGLLWFNLWWLLLYGDVC